MDIVKAVKQMVIKIFLLIVCLIRVFSLYMYCNYTNSMNAHLLNIQLYLI